MKVNDHRIFPSSFKFVLEHVETHIFIHEIDYRLAQL